MTENIELLAGRKKKKKKKKKGTEDTNGLKLNGYSDLKSNPRFTKERVLRETATAEQRTDEDGDWYRSQG